MQIRGGRPSRGRSPSAGLLSMTCGPRSAGSVDPFRPVSTQQLSDSAAGDSAVGVGAGTGVTAGPARPACSSGPGESAEPPVPAAPGRNPPVPPAPPPPLWVPVPAAPGVPLPISGRPVKRLDGRVDRSEYLLLRNVQRRGAHRRVESVWSDSRPAVPPVPLAPVVAPVPPSPALPSSPQSGECGDARFESRAQRRTICLAALSVESRVAKRFLL